MAITRTEEVVIIGTGPAGLTAAIYMARANFKPIVIEGLQPGGQLTMTTDIENFPGFPEGISGYELMDRMRKQAERFGTVIESGNVIKLAPGKERHIVTYETMMGDKIDIAAKSVIIATGASAKLIGIEGEKELMGYGVSACATCDGAFYRDKEVVVVGGGDTAMEEATFLTRFASKVTIVHRRQGFRASHIMVEKAKANPKIAWKLDRVVAEIEGSKEDGLQALILENPKTKERERIETDGLFVAIGHRPNVDFIDDIERNDAGYIAVKPGTSLTSIKGIFSCGDVSDPKYRQAVTAAGFGCAAALECKTYLE